MPQMSPVAWVLLELVFWLSFFVWAVLVFNVTNCYSLKFLSLGSVGLFKIKFK